MPKPGVAGRRHGFPRHGGAALGHGPRRQVEHFAGKSRCEVRGPYGKFVPLRSRVDPDITRDGQVGRLIPQAALQGRFRALANPHNQIDIAADAPIAAGVGADAKHRFDRAILPGQA